MNEKSSVEILRICLICGRVEPVSLLPAARQAEPGGAGQVDGKELELETKVKRRFHVYLYRGVNTRLE